MSRTTVECTWVGVLTIFQMGGAIGAVIASPGSACSVDGMCDESDYMFSKTNFMTSYSRPQQMCLRISAHPHSVVKRSPLSVARIHHAMA